VCVARLGEVTTQIKREEIMNDTIEIYTVKELSNVLKCSLSQSYALVNASGFPSIRIGGKIVVERKALENWLEKNKGKRVAI
jgi:excisionase family DNA binding protein